MRKFGLVGKNISYSFSRGYFAEKFRDLGLDDHSYENFDLQELSGFPKLVSENPGLVGLNVTIPYKEAIMPYLDRIDEAAQRIGAVNTIRVGPDGLEGFNTDVIGFRESLRPLLLPEDRCALILGTGGASKAVAYALDELGISHRYVSRTPGEGCLTYEALDKAILGTSQILVNCTPLGTFPDTDRSPQLPYELLGPEHLLYDLIYNPPLTTFLKEGQQRGCRIKNGLEMLQIQADRAWVLWNH